jgi:8-oxo-dGTP pyrophosphatase MutT (NUDIX family)
MARWYAGMVIVRQNDEGEREYLVIDTKSVIPKFADRPMQTKFCGGTEENHEEEDKTIIHTFHRELLEETGMRFKEHASFELIYGERPNDNHEKRFYEVAFTDLVGELRTEEKTVDGDWMSPPYWLSYEEACRALFRTHQAPLIASEDRFQTMREYEGL